MGITKVLGLHVKLLHGTQPSSGPPFVVPGPLVVVVPTEHDLQATFSLLLPSWSLYVPLRHSVQFSTVSPTASQYLPFAQSVQLLAPVLFDHFPAGHSKHALTVAPPVVARNVPATHAMHVLLFVAATLML